MTSDRHSEGANIDQYRYIHQSKDEYGAGSRHFEYVQMILACCGFDEVLDYGCGKGVLADQLNKSGTANCSKYDPAMPGIDALPTRTYDAVINTDVLEHVPEEELGTVIGNLTKLSRNAVIIPHLEKAREILPNGENAHCTIKTPDEWQGVFTQFYEHVFLLSHDSRRHALFFCSQDISRSDCMDLATQYLVAGKTSSDEVRLRLDAALGSRLKSSAKLMLGSGGVNAIRSVANLFRLNK